MSGRLHSAYGPGEVVAAQPTTGLAPYSPAITWPGNTVSAITAVYVRTAGQLTAWGFFTESAGTATALLTIPLPAGFSVAAGGTGLAGFAWPSSGGAPLAPVVGTAFATSVGATATGVASSWYFQYTVPV